MIEFEQKARTKENIMNIKLGGPRRAITQSVTHCPALLKFGLGTAVLLVALSSVLPSDAASPDSMRSSVIDAAGDAAFPYDLYNGPVPPWIDVVQASVTLTHGTFHFEIKVSADIPANGDPGFTPSVNHLGSTFGLETDRKTACHFNFFGQQGSYYFNFLVGALYLAQDAGIGGRVGMGFYSGRTVSPKFL